MYLVRKLDEALSEHAETRRDIIAIAPDWDFLRRISEIGEESIITAYGYPIVWTAHWIYRFCENDMMGRFISVPRDPSAVAKERMERWEAELRKAQAAQERRTERKRLEPTTKSDVPV